jgi:hypothetical protein
MLITTWSSICLFWIKKSHLFPQTGDPSRRPVAPPLHVGSQADPSSCPGGRWSHPGKLQWIWPASPSIFHTDHPPLSLSAVPSFLRHALAGDEHPTGTRASSSSSSIRAQPALSSSPLWFVSECRGWRAACGRRGRRWQGKSWTRTAHAVVPQILRVHALVKPPLSWLPPRIRGGRARLDPGCLCRFPLGTLLDPARQLRTRGRAGR